MFLKLFMANHLNILETYFVMKKKQESVENTKMEQKVFQLHDHMNGTDSQKDTLKDFKKDLKTYLFRKSYH